MCLFGTHIVKINRIVQNISMNSPRSMLVFGSVLSVVRTARSPGKRLETMPAAAIAPRI